MPRTLLPGDSSCQTLQSACPRRSMNRVLAAFVLTGACAAAAQRDAARPSAARRPAAAPARPRDRHPAPAGDPARRHGARDGGGNGRHHVRAPARVAHRGHPRCRSRPRRGQRHPRRLGAAGAGSPAERGAGHAPRRLRFAARPHPARHVRDAAPQRPLLLSRRAGARAAGLELRRGRDPLRLAAPVQRHRRPLHPRPADHRAAPAGGGRQRNAAGNGRERGRHADVPLGAGRADPQLPDRAAGGRFRAGPARRRAAGHAHGPARGVDHPGHGEERRVRLWRHAAHGRVLLPQVRLRVSLGRVTTRSRCASSPAPWRPPARWASPSPSCAAPATRPTRGRRSARPIRRGRARTPSPTSWPITGSATSSPAARWRRCG